MPSGDSTHINFNARATLRKWPSKNNERDKGVLHPHPYLVIDGTLDECIKKFLELPVNQRHLYEIHTAPQGGLDSDQIPQRSGMTRCAKAGQLSLSDRISPGNALPITGAAVAHLCT